MNICGTNDMKKHADIRQSIINSLNSRFCLPSDNLPTGIDGGFWGVNSPIDALDIVYLVYILETEYDIFFSGIDFDDPSFFTMEGLTELIMQKLQPESMKARM